MPEPTASPAGPAWHRLPFHVERQEAPHGCWSAVASAVSRFYAPGGGGLTQEEIQARAGGDARNRIWYPDRALELAGCYAGKLPRALEPEELHDEIGGGRVVVARIAWSYGGGHLVALSGLSSAGEVWVDDPRYGPSPCPYPTLVGGEYLRFGRWTHSYLTRPPV